MTDEHRRKLLDAAALWILIGVALVALGVREGHAVPLLLAWFPIRWGLVRAVAAAGPRAPAPLPRREPPFGYHEGGPV
jgi:hypothetical protein